MWIEARKDGKFNLRERYKDPYTGKTRTGSIVIEKNTPQVIKKSQKILLDKINNKLETDPNQKNINFGELYTEWFRYYKVQNKRSSWIKVPFYLDKHVFPTITKDMLVKNITSELIMKVIDNMYTFGDYSLNYTKQTRTTISAMFNFAVDKGYIEQNPVSKTKVMPKRETERKNKKKLSEKYLEKEEIDLLLSALYSKNSNKLHGMISEFLVLTGLRYGELQALQWKNFDGKSISVEGTLDYTLTTMDKAIKTSTKNESSERIIALPHKAIEILLDLQKINSLKFTTEPEDYIFLSRFGNPLSIHAFNPVIKRAGNKIGLEKNITSHIFRHTHVSLLAESNIPLKAIMERVGHADANTTLSIYNHVTKKSKEQITAALDNLF